MAISQDFVDKYTTQVTAQNDSLGFLSRPDALIAGAVADFGTTLWNSALAIPSMIGADMSAYKAGTYDMLKSVNEDWATYYTEHKDAVEAASFIGGALVPGGLAMKGMKLLQAGKLGFYPAILGDAAQTARTSALVSMVENGASATKEFGTLKWKVLGTDVAQQFGQAAGAEFAVLATMNQHAWIEDYLKDPLKNFTISLGFGGVIGSGLGQLVLRNQLAKALSAPIEAALNVNSKGLAINIPLGISEVDKVQFFKQNAQILRDNAANPEYNPLTREMASQFAMHWEGQIGEAEKKIFGSILTGSSAEAKAGARELVLNPLSFGANTVDLLNLSEEAVLKTGVREQLSLLKNKMLRTQVAAAIEADTNPEVLAGLLKAGESARLSILGTLSIQKYVPNWDEMMTGILGKVKSAITGEKIPGQAFPDLKVYYSPEFQAYIPRKDFMQFTKAVDLGRTEGKTALVGKLTGDGEMNLIARSRPAAMADSYWIDTLKTVDGFPIDKKVHIDSADPAMMNAWLAKLSTIDTTKQRLPQIFLTDVSGPEIPQSVLKATKSAEITLPELRDATLALKEKYIKGLVGQGASFQEISIRMNIPQTAIEEYLANGTPLREVDNAFKYTIAKDIGEKYLAQENRMLVLTSNPSRIQSAVLRRADQQTMLDSKTIQLMNQQIMDTVIADSKSNMANTYFTALDSYKMPWEIIRAGLSQANNELSGNSFVSSADFWTRRMGDMSQAAIAMGQTYTGVANQLSREQLQGLSGKLRVHTGTQAGFEETNRVLNRLAAMQEYRNVDENGILYRYAQGAEGKLVKTPISWEDGTAMNLSDGMKGVLFELQAVSREQYNFKNTLNQIQGFKDMKDIGLHIPSFDPTNKFISYVIDKTASESEGRVKLLIGRSPEQLAKLEQDWQMKYGMQNDRYELVTKGNQQDYNFWQQRLDPIDMDHADISKFHSGSSASFEVPTDETLTTTLIQRLHGRILYYGKQMQQMYLSDIMDSLDAMSKINQRFFKDQPLDARTAATHQPKDAALAFKNLLLGNNQLDQYQTWQTVNNSFGSMIDWASNRVGRLLSSFKSSDLEGRALNEGEWKRFANEQVALGVKNPFASFNDYVTTQNLIKSGKLTGDAASTDFAAKLSEMRIGDVQRRLSVSAPRAEDIISAGAGLTSTLALRILELGQPLTNLLSVPILALPALMQNMPKTFMGTALADGIGVAFPARVMYDGVRFRHSEMAKPLIAEWVRQGFGKNVVGDITELNNWIMSGDKTVIGKINQAISKDSGIIKTLSKPSDMAESESRLLILSVGFQAAKQAYPGISNEGADLFAKAFMARGIGNYYSGQRPAMFQGTFGVAMGLFQTYMLSWTQSAFRSIEEGNMKALGGQMLSQMGFFGMSSLPLYDAFSKTIGAHFSDKHFDLTTGTYRALPSPMAEFVTYGLPASMGVGLYTRGDLQPRLPLVSQNNPLDTFAAINVVHQMYSATAGTMSKMLQANGMGDKARALLEGLSTQSLSRPIARIAEAAPVYDSTSGKWEAVGSITKDGNTVATSAQVWSIPGVLSRVLSSRSTEEQIAKETDYLSSYYGTIDYQNRKATTAALKTSIRAGSLDEKTIEDITTKYMRQGGTSSGFKAAVNESFATSETGIVGKLQKKIKPGSPFMGMIEDSY